MTKVITNAREDRPPGQALQLAIPRPCTAFFARIPDEPVPAPLAHLSLPYDVEGAITPESPEERARKSVREPTRTGRGDLVERAFRRTAEGQEGWYRGDPSSSLRSSGH